MQRKSIRKALGPPLGCMLIAVSFSVSVVGQALVQEHSDGLKDLLENVFLDRSTEVRTLRNCAYSEETAIKDVGSMQERYDPSVGLGLEWQLLQINGKEPTAQQLHNYKAISRKRHPAVLNFDFINLDSLQLEDQSQSKLQFSYKLVPNASDGLNEFVSHKLSIHAETGQLLEIKSIASEPFRIQPWIRIQEYESVSTFRFEEQTNGTVLEQLQFKLVVKSNKHTLERAVTKRYSDFDCSNLIPAVNSTDPDQPGNDEKDLESYEEIQSPADSTN